jgi:hypothetical protein
MFKKINLRQAIAASFFVTLTSIFGFAFFESNILRAIEDQFTITQTITSEISFVTATDDVTMSGTIAGLTGGVSYGSTTVRIFTNDNSGFTATVKASSSPAMQGNYQGGTIADYTPSTAGIPDFSYSVPTGAEFGFTIVASTTADMAQKFKDNGAVCNTGSSDTGTSASCWMGLSTTATSTLVTSTYTAASGATSTIVFRTTVNSGSSLPEDTYTATTTITAVTN